MFRQLTSLISRRILFGGRKPAAVINRRLESVDYNTLESNTRIERFRKAVCQESSRRVSSSMFKRALSNLEIPSKCFPRRTSLTSPKLARLSKKTKRIAGNVLTWRVKRARKRTASRKRKGTRFVVRWIALIENIRQKTSPIS